MPTTNKRATKAENQEIAHIREDLDSLRHNVVALSRSIKHGVTETAMTRYEKLKNRGNQTLEQAEQSVREHPGRSVLTAFGVGVLLSAFLRRS